MLSTNTEFLFYFELRVITRSNLAQKSSLEVLSDNWCGGGRVLLRECEV